MKIGVDIGGSHIAIAVVDTKGKIIEKIEKRFTSRERKNFKKSIEEYITEHANQLMQEYHITEMGIAMPGWSENGVILFGGNLDLKGYPIIERLQEKVNLPIKIRNDAKTAAMAECAYG